MPVKKLRSLSDAEESCWFDRSDPVLWRTIASLWEFSKRIAPQRFPRGVHKFHSIDEANVGACGADSKWAKKAGLE